MSWSEVKKLNSDFAREPLNFNNYINDISIFGNRSYVLDTENETLWKDLIVNSLTMYGHDAIHETIYERFTDTDIDYMLRNNSQLGQSFNSFYGVTYFPAGGIDKVLSQLTVDSYDSLEPKFKSGIYRYISEKTAGDTAGQWLGTLYNNDNLKAKTNIASIVSNTDIWTNDIMTNASLRRVISLSQTTVEWFAANPSTAYVNFITEVCHNTDATMALFTSLSLVNDLTDFMNNETVVTTLANNQESMVATTFMIEPFAALISSEVAMTAVANSEVAMNVIISSITNVTNSETVLDGIDGNLTTIKNALPNIANTELVISEVGQAKTVVAEVVAKLETVSSQTHTLIDNIDDLVNSSTAMNAVAASSTAMNAVAASSTAMNAVAASSTAMNAVAASSTAMNAIYNSSIAVAKYAVSCAGLNPVDYADMNAVAASSTAMNAVAASSTAMNAVAKSTFSWTDKKAFFVAINNDIGLCRKIFTACSDTTYFTVKISTYENNVTNLNSSCTANYAQNGIIACCLGYYGTASASTVTLAINNETIISRGGYKQPPSVTNANVNAIGIPEATFTENNNGYAAIAVFIAK